MAKIAGLTVLITNIRVAERTGTETQTASLAQYLLAQGHRPIVYSPALGALAQQIRSRAIPVVSDIANLDTRIDVIHGHHNPTTAIAVARFPDVPAIFVCHDFTAWHDAPPLLPSILRYVAVSEAMRDRLILEGGIPAASVELEPNAVDLERFTPGPALPRQPRRALVIAKSYGYLDAIREACAARGIALDVAGHAAGKPIDAPEMLIPGYDLVFASALSAMEAMAMGRAVVCCDGRGLAGMVGTGTYAAWRPANFGLRCQTQAVTKETVLAALDAYDAEDAGRLSKMLRAEGGWLAAAERWVQRYRKVIAEWQQQPAPEAATRVALAKHLQTWLPVSRRRDEWPWMVEREMLLGQVDQLAKRLEPLPLGTTQDFGLRAKRNWYMPDLGFGDRERHVAWTVAKTATFRVRLADGATQALSAALTLWPIFEQDSEEPLGLEILAGGKTVLQTEIQRREAPRCRRKFRIPQEALPPSGILQIELRVSRVLATVRAGVQVVTPVVGIGLIDLIMQAASDGDVP